MGRNATALLRVRRACQGGVMAACRQGQSKGSKLDAHASPWARGAEPRRLRFRGFEKGRSFDPNISSLKS